MESLQRLHLVSSYNPIVVHHRSKLISVFDDIAAICSELVVPNLFPKEQFKCQKKITGNKDILFSV